MEQLETRRVLATFTVNSSGDHVGSCVGDEADCTLRTAIRAANENTGVDRIEFASTIEQPFVIRPTTLFDAINDSVVIDGYTAPGSRPNTDQTNAVLTVELDGSALNIGSSAGLKILSNDSTVRGLVFRNFSLVGIEVAGNNNILEGNFIGTDRTGAFAHKNKVGIHVSGNQNTIGGNRPQARNLISGNITGLLVRGDRNKVLNNYVGADNTGMESLPNQTGIYITGSENTIGQVGTPNVISGNALFDEIASSGIGILLAGAKNQLKGNLIGTDPGGRISVPNFTGVNVVGDQHDVDANVISGNLGPGLVLGNDDLLLASNSVFTRNLIGVDRDGTKPLPNSDFGIQILCGSNNRMGSRIDDDAIFAQGNVISGNGAGGILIGSTFENPGVSSENILQANMIGTDIAGTFDIPNEGHGIQISTGTDNIIGGNRLDLENTISGNFGSGVFIGSGFAESRAARNILIGNRIGTDQMGEPIPNQGSGVTIAQAASSNVIGGVEPGESNIIAFNRRAGVLVMATDELNRPEDNLIRGNAIFENGGLGIDLSISEISDGVTANDDRDLDVGPNGLQNFPLITRAVTGLQTYVSGILNSQPNASFVLDFYEVDSIDPSGSGEGDRHLGSMPMQTDISGNASFNVELPQVTRGTKFMTATASGLSDRPMGMTNTSEFSPAVAVSTSAAVAGIVFADVNGNGRFERHEEPALTGIAVTLIRDDVGELEIQTIDTDQEGRYVFTELIPGKYTLSVDSPLVATTMNPRPVNLESGDVFVSQPGLIDELSEGQTERVQSELDFGQFQQIRVGGRLYNDRNANGVLDLGEPGLANWQLELQITNPNGTVEIKQFTTGDNGRFLFDRVGPGQAELSYIRKPDWGPEVFQNISFLTQSGIDVSKQNLGVYLALATGIVAGNSSVIDSGPGVVVVANDLSNPVDLASTLTVFRTTDEGNEVLAPNQTIELPKASRPQAIFVSDLNGDGSQDLAVASVGMANQPSSHGILLHRAESDEFSERPHVLLECQTRNKFATADRCDGPIDIDAGSKFLESGVIDLMVSANFRSNNISVIQTRTNGDFFGATQIQHIPVGMQPVAARIGNMNGDGIADIVVANHESGSLTILLGRANDTFDAQPPITGLDQPMDVLLIESATNDTHDIVVPNHGSGRVSVFSNNGSGLFSVVQRTVGNGPHSVAWGDVDGDSNADLLIANAEGGNITVLLSDQGDFSRRVEFGLPPVPEINPSVGQTPHAILMEDLDGIGRMDIIVAHLFGGISVHLNGVENLAGANSAYLLDSSSRSGEVNSALDVNGDGWVAPNDVLLVVNALHAKQSGARLNSQFHTDVNRDGTLAPIDALLVVNWLNTPPVSSDQIVSELTLADLESIKTSAIQHWKSVGVPASLVDELARLDYRIEDLPGFELGRLRGSTIILDTDAAGEGWFVDRTPNTDFEFRDWDGMERSTMIARMDDAAVDLLTVVLHEMGHVLHFEHDSTGLGLMGKRLLPGVRYLPSPEWIDEAIQACC